MLFLLALIGSVQERHDLGAGADTVGLKAEVCAVSYAVLDRPCDRLCVPCTVLHVGKAGGLGGLLVACRVPQDHDDLRTGDAVVGIVVAGAVTIDDVVSYKNLTVGKEYTVSGVLMDKSTGKAFLVDGKEIRSEVTFTPETADGEVTVSFTFDGSVITKETEIVVFETLYREGTEIAGHADIEDENQTVTIHPQPEPEKPQTGDDSNLGFYIGLGSVAVGGLIAFLIIKFKKKDEDDE